MHQLGPWESFKRCGSGIVMPWRLPLAAVHTSSWVAVLLGSLTLGWYVASIIVALVLISDGPYPSWSFLGRDVIEVLPLVVLLIMGVAGFSLLLHLVLHIDAKRKHELCSVRAIALSFIPLVIPYSLWCSFYCLTGLSAEVMHQSDSVRAILGNVLFRAFASCFWYPAFIVAWIQVLRWMFGRVDRIAQGLGLRCVCDCGYDLRGSIAGGAATCPECGAMISDAARKFAPSIHTST